MQVCMAEGVREEDDLYCTTELAGIYSVPTKRLNEQVLRNAGRFPPDFMFQLTMDEAEVMRSQSATASKRNRRHLPRVFTEEGAVMLASVLNSEIAIRASVQVVRAFFLLRGMLSKHKELAERLDALEKRYDSQFRNVFEAIRGLLTPEERSRPRKIGFR